VCTDKQELCSLHLIEIVDENHNEEIEDDVGGQDQEGNEVDHGDVGIGIVRWTR
jgi:hypothetical protein